MGKFRIDQETSVELVALKVKDIEKQLNFYKDLLKFDILSEENGMVFLGIKETKESLLILLEQPDGLSSPYIHNGLNHLGLVVPTRQKLSKIYQHLEKNDYPILELVDHGYAESIVIRDPEFNVLEIYWDKDDSENAFACEYAPLDLDSLLAETDEPYETLTTEARVGHVQLNVVDLEKSRDFYENVLGFQIRDARFRSVNYLTTSSYHHHLCLSNWEQVDVLDDKHLGLDYISFHLESMEALKALKENVEAMGCQFFFNKGKKILQVDDPNGIHIWFRVKPKK
ncbi:VOC family protein [Vagococcus elongatus]|nr:VOC family protein [Vagococcus elongatus]